MCERLCGTQKVSDSVEVVLILFNGLDAHSVFGQKGFVTRRVTGRRQEFEITMATAQEEASSVG